MIKNTLVLAFFTGEANKFKVYPAPLEEIEDVNELNKFAKEMETIAKDMDMGPVEIEDKVLYKRLQEFYNA